MKDVLPEVVSLSVGEQNAQNFSLEAKAELQEDFKDLRIMVRNWSQRLSRMSEGIGRIASEKRNSKLANLFTQLAQREGATGLIYISLEGDDKARIGMALFSLEEIAARNKGVLDTEKSKPVHKNPGYYSYNKIGLEARPWQSESLYVFKSA